MDLAGFRFQDPAWLLGLVLCPLVLVVAHLRERQAPAIVFPGAARLRGLRRGWRLPLRWLPLGAAATALAVGSVALARPQKGALKESVTTRGVDIVIALDVSGSMAAEDFQPRNRLEVAKEVVSEFVRKRTSDRVGLVVFAVKSLTKVPPTTDQAVLLKQLDDVHLGMMADDRTAIGSGMATALTRLRRSQARSRIIVLVTDGGNNSGEIDPATATDLARAMEVRVYTIGVGREGEVPLPVQERDPFTGALVKRTVQVEVKFDEALLQGIASQTGGEYFRASDPAALRGVFEKVDQLERSEIKLTSYRRYRELFPPFLSLAAGLLVAGGLLRAAGLRVTPV
jgi:Ca-activated chloride channel family protein